MNYKRFKKYIVVDESGRPMAYSPFDKNGGQFCYCHTEKWRRPYALEVYSLKKAKALIVKSNEWRKAKSFDTQDGKYLLMPVK